MIVVVSLAAAYDIFLLPYSVSDIYSEYHAGERLSTSGFNWAAGMYGGQLVGEVRGYYGEIRFFSSGKMEETDENGNVIGEFYSNFIRLKAGKHFSLGRYRLILGGGFMYIGLAPRERALSPFIYFYGFRDINFKKAALEIFSLLDNLGYEAFPIGLSRDVLPIRFSSGMKIKGNRFSGLAEVSYFSVGGISGKVGGDISINILNIGINLDTRYRQLNGGYGLDFLSGLSVYGNLYIRKFKVSYSHTFMGLFSNRNILQISYLF